MAQVFRRIPLRGSSERSESDHVPVEVDRCHPLMEVTGSLSLRVANFIIIYSIVLHLDAAYYIYTVGEIYITE